MAREGNKIGAQGLHIHWQVRHRLRGIHQHQSPRRVRLGGNWVGPYSPFDQPGVVLGAYGLAHVSVAVPFGTPNSLSLDLGVRNIFDHAYPELVAGGIVSPGQPRSLSVALHATM